MRRLLTLLFLVAGVIAQPARSAAPAAIVTDLRGSVRDASGAPVELLTELAPDARIVLPPASRLALVHLAAKATFELSGPGSYAVRATGIEALAGAQQARGQPLPAAYGAVRLQPARIAQASIAMRGATASDQRLRLASPVATWVLDPVVRLRWESSLAAESYKVQLTDSENRVLFDAVTRETSIALPADVQLEPGRMYGWQVQATGRGADAWAEFGIADPPLRARIEQARPRVHAPLSERILYALFLEALDVHEAARAEWARIARDQPQESRLRTLSGGG